MTQEGWLAGKHNIVKVLIKNIISNESNRSGQKRYFCRRGYLLAE